MQLIGASLVFVCDEDFTIIKNSGVVFENGRILTVGEYKELESKLEYSADFMQILVNYTIAVSVARTRDISGILKKSK